MSVYAVYKSTTVRTLSRIEYEDVSKVRAELYKDEMREETQFEAIQQLKSNLSNQLSH